MARKRPDVYVRPDDEAIRVARLGLDVRSKASPSNRCCLTTQEAGKAGIGSGIARARDIIAGKRVNAFQVKAYFDRHRGHYRNALSKASAQGVSLTAFDQPEPGGEAARFAAGPQGKPVQGWWIWGGDTMRQLAEDAVADWRSAEEGSPRSSSNPSVLLVGGPESGRVGSPMRPAKKNPVSPTLSFALVGVAATLAAAAGVTLWVRQEIAKKAATPPKVSPDPDFDDFDDESGGSAERPPMPMLGSGEGDCFGDLWDSGTVGPEVRALMNPAARAVVTPPNGKWVWSDSQGNVHTFQPARTKLSTKGQVAVFKLATTLLSGPNRGTLSMTTRQVLKTLMPGCNWDADLWPSFGRESLSKNEYNMFTSVWYLVKAAARQVNYHVGGAKPDRHLMIPKGGGNGLIIGRGYLDLPDVAPPGTLSLVPGQRVELLGGDYKKVERPRPPFFHAEPLYARVVESSSGRPTVEILAAFQGQDVAPKFAHRHGFGVGRRLRLPGTGTTAVRKIFPVGVS